jgi:DAK2 domain fusion protein YloV
MANSIDIKILKEMFLNGAKFVSDEYEYINELNVFPVPDGDTGTNLKITIGGACDSIKVVDHQDLFTLGKQFSRGLLMNARGNSGVIFSQIIKGFTSNFKEGQIKLSIDNLIESFANATKVAYESMVTPIEGTILTVIRETSEALKSADEHQTNSIESIFKYACQVAKKTLAKTPEILQELKEAGVVDSGGYGLCCFLNGMLSCLTKVNAKTNTSESENKDVVRHIIDKKSFIENLRDKNEGFGYCTEFIMILKSKIYLEQKEKNDFNLKYFKKIMTKLGDSLAVIADDNIVKVHIHTKRPYSVLEQASLFGEFSKIKIENMTFQFLENNPGTTLESIGHKEYKGKANLSNTVKIIATVPSNEIAEIFKNQLKIDDTIITDIAGNPSISVFFKMIKQTNSSNLIIVVDDSNIVLAAKEAIKLTPKFIKIELLKANDIGSSYLACNEYDSGLNFKLNFNNISDMLEHCSSAKISYSVKNLELYGVKIKKNEFIGIFQKKILFSNRNMQYVCKKIIDRVVNDVKRPKSAYIFYNKQVKTEDINFVRKYINETHFLKVNTIFGNQENYPFIICIK